MGIYPFICFEKSYGKHWYLLFPDRAERADSDAEYYFFEFLEQQLPKLETMLMHSGVPVHSSLKQNQRFADDEAFEHYASNAVRLWFQKQYLASDEGKVYDTFRKHLDRSAVCVSIGQDMASSTSRPSKSVEPLRQRDAQNGVISALHARPLSSLARNCSPRSTIIPHCPSSLIRPTRIIRILACGMASPVRFPAGWKGRCNAQRDM